MGLKQILQVPPFQLERLPAVPVTARPSLQNTAITMIGKLKQGEGRSRMSKAVWRTKIDISIAKKYTSRHNNLFKCSCACWIP